MSHVRVEIDPDRIATLWLDAPGKRVNTLSKQMWGDLFAGIDEIQNAKAIGAILTSAKPNTFCAGADLFEIRDISDEAFDEYIRTGQEILKRIESLPIPIIAAINGDCFGGGYELALSCTVRLAANDSEVVQYRIGLPEIGLGLVPGWGGTVRLPRMIGPKGVALIRAGKTLRPTDALAMRLVEDILPPAELLPMSRKLLLDLIARPPSWQSLADYWQYWMLEVLDWAKVADDAPPAERKVIDVILAGLRHGPQAGFDAERKAIVELRRTPECQTAMQKFFDRKKPS